MRCNTKAMALAVATATMKRMTEADYTLFAPFGDESFWHIAKNDETAAYRIEPQPNGDMTAPKETFATCNCLFYIENAEFKVCKHGLYVAREIAFLAWVDEQEALLTAAEEHRHDHIDDEQEIPAEVRAAVERGIGAAREQLGIARVQQSTEAAPCDWPTCPMHGPHYAATNGQPMSTCDRCEEYR